MIAVYLHYQTPRGASVAKRIDTAEQARRTMGTLRRPAVLLADGVTVGGVEECDNADDQRIRWQWWFDVTAFRAGGAA